MVNILWLGATGGYCRLRQEHDSKSDSYSFKQTIYYNI